MERTAVPSKAASRGTGIERGRDTFGSGPYMLNQSCSLEGHLRTFAAGDPAISPTALLLTNQPFAIFDTFCVYIRLIACMLNGRCGCGACAGIPIV